MKNIHKHLQQYIGLRRGIFCFHQLSHWTQSLPADAQNCLGTVNLSPSSPPS